MQKKVATGKIYLCGSFSWTSYIPVQGYGIY